MNLKKSRVLSLATSLLVMSASIVGLSATAANASSAPVTVTFEANDTSGYAFVDYDGAATSTTSSAPAGAGFTSGVAMKQDNQGELWSGTTFLTIDPGSSLLSAANKTATLSVYSPDAVDRCVDLKLEGTAVAEKTLHVTGAGWQTLTFDYSDVFSSTANYYKASLMPNIGGEGCSWGGGKSQTIWYFDNISFPGATKADVVIPRTAPSGLVNFEANDTTGYTAGGSADFGGTIGSKVSNAPAGGSVGSTSALKLENLVNAASWSGETFLTLGAKASVVSAGKTVITANVYAPAAGLDMMMKIQSAVTGGFIEKHATSVQGWQKVSYDFANYDASMDYNMLIFFPDFNGVGTPKTASTWYIDDIAFNGATSAALDTNAGSGGNTGGGTPVAFNGNAVIRLAGADATNTFNRQGDADFFVGQGWYRGGLRTFTKQVPVGSTQHLTFVVSDAANGSPLANTTVHFIVAKTYSGSTAKVSVGSVSTVADQKIIDGVTDANGTVSFDLANSDVAADAADYPGADLSVNYAGKHLFSQVTAWVGDQAKDSIDLVDIVYYAPATVVPAPQIVTRINGITADNAAAGSTEGWAQYYAAGLQYFERGVEVGTTTHLSYTVTANGAPYANKTVHLLLGKQFSGSTAKVSVNGHAYTGAEVVVDLTTDANGVVSFDVANTNVTADADPYQAANVLHPANGKHLFAQLALVGEKGNQDVLDMLDLVYYRNQAATPPTVLNLRLADWNASNSFDGTHVWGDGGLGSWFDATTGYFAHYVKVGSTFNLRYSVKTAAGVAAPNGTVVTLYLGSAWSGSNAKFSVNGVAVSGVTKWGANGQLDQATTTAVVSGGYITVPVTSLDVAEDATTNPGSATANPDGFNPLFMQIKAHVEGNFITQQDWINIVATQSPAAPTISSTSGTSGKKGQAIDIVGTNLADAMGVSVSLFTAATAKTAAVTTPVTILGVSADGTRLTVLSPNVSQKGYFKVTTSAGTATGTTAFSASTTATSKPSLTFPASLVKEVGSTLTLTGTNLGSASTVKIGTVAATFTVVDASTIKVTIPVGVVSGSAINVTNAGGTVTSTKLIFQAPVITTATSSGVVGSTVTVVGKNIKATAIVFGGNKTAKPVINDGSNLTFVVPAGATTGAIKITTGGGDIFTSSFTVVPPAPTVASFTPASGRKGSAIVTVKGTNLLGATVTVGSVAVTLSAGATATSFKFVIPATAVTGAIRVTTAGGTATSATNLTVTN